MACHHRTSNPTSVPVFLPRFVTTLDDEEIPTGQWAILVDVAGDLHVTHVWGVERGDEDERILLFSSKSGEYIDDEDADCRDFMVEAHETKDAACRRAQLLDDAYEVCKHVYHSRYLKNAPDLVFREWARMYSMPWSP